MNRCFNEFTKKPLKVVDLIHFISNKQVVTIIYNDDEKGDIELFDGRAEDLTYTAEGCLHDLAMCDVTWFETTSVASKLIIYIEDPDAENDCDQKIEHGYYWVDVANKEMIHAKHDYSNMVKDFDVLRHCFGITHKDVINVIPYSGTLYAYCIGCPNTRIPVSMFIKPEYL